jgi:hypothetical protein
MGLNLAEITGTRFSERSAGKVLPQFRFQLLNLTAQGRLGHSQALGCASEMTFFRQNCESTEVSQFH